MNNGRCEEVLYMMIPRGCRVSWREKGPYASGEILLRRSVKISSERRDRFGGKVSLRLDKVPECLR